MIYMSLTNQYFNKSKLESIKIIDSYSVGQFHEVFNTCLVAMCDIISTEVELFTSESAAVNFISRFNEHFSEYTLPSISTYKVNSKFDKKSAFKRTLKGAFLSTKEYLKAKRKQILIYNYTPSLSFWLVALVNRFLKKRVVFTMHGELELITKPIEKRHLRGLYTLLNKIAFKFIPGSRAKVMVLGDSIRDNLLLRYPRLKNNILSICHPTWNGVDGSQVEGVLCENRPLKLGTIGLMNGPRGWNSLKYLSDHLEAEIREGTVEIKVIGRYESNELSLHNIKALSDGGFICREDFERNIKNLDFILYLYPSTSYKLTASGAIMDSINLGIPFIAIRNEYFEYLCGDNPFGFFADDDTELVGLIKRLIRNKTGINFTEAYKDIKKKVSIDYNAFLLKEQLKNWDN